MARLRQRYANALLEISTEKETLEKDLEQIVLIRDLLSQKEVKAFLTHPHIPNQAKYQLFQKAFSDVISHHIMAFLYLCVRKNRELLIVPALNEYISKANSLLGRVEARIVSSKELSQKQIESVRNILTDKLNKQVEVEAGTDPDVIAGFYVLADGKIFDGTLKSQMNNLKERLKRGDFYVSKS
jgi:F-type H+-transporting ATPase subunit delta